MTLNVKIKIGFKNKTNVAFKHHNCNHLKKNLLLINTINHNQTNKNHKSKNNIESIKGSFILTFSQIDFRVGLVFQPLKFFNATMQEDEECMHDFSFQSKIHNSFQKF